MENDSTDEPARQLSDLQEKVLAILPLPSALLSVIGSSIILLMALESRKHKQWTPCTRLLVGLSLSDILYSVSISIASFLRPKDSSNFVYALGNDASCNAAGFLNQLGLSAIFYNAALSFYFLATARYGVSAKQFSRRMEKIIHIVSLGHPILTASIGLYLGLYAERRGILGCGLEHDKRCTSEDPEVRALASNCSAGYTRFLFRIVPSVFTFIVLIVNNLVISRFVQTKVKKYRHSGDNSPRKRGATVLERSSSAITDDNSVLSSEESAASTMRTEKVAAVVAPQNSSSSLDDLQAIQKTQHRRLKLVRSQAFLFVASYALCHVWTMVMSIGNALAKGDEKAESEFLVTYYPLAVLQAIFQPLQGMLNMLVFVRPKYLKWKSEFPRETKWWAFRRSIFGDRIRPTINMDRPNISRPEGKDEGTQLGHTGVEKNDKDDSKSVGDRSHVASNTFVADSRLRGDLSALTASLGDFDHVIEDGIEDERWDNERSDTLTSWGPPIRRSRYSTSSGTLRGSSLEVISENMESIFEAFPTEASISTSVAYSKKQQQHVPLESSISPEKREGPWSPCSSLTGSTRSTDLLASRLWYDASFDADLSLDTTTCRWSSESIKPEAANAASITPNSSGNSVSMTSAASLDSRLVPPRRRLSPPPSENESEDDDDADDKPEEKES